MRVFLRLLIILVIGAVIAGVIIYLPELQGSGSQSAAPAGDVGGILINEVMSANKGIYPDNKGNSSDWLEIYNNTDRDINLGGCALSDDEKKPEKWPFPNMTLKARGYQIIFLSGDPSFDLNEGFIHCSFKLSSQGEKLILAGGAGKIIDSVDIPALPDNISYAKAGDEWRQTEDITPGYENSDAGRQAFVASMTVTETPLVINEVMTSNAMTIADSKGEYTDWVELLNTGGEDLKLEGYGLSDDPGDPLKWRFPDVTLKAGESLLVFCSGVDAPYTGEGSLYADFKLSSYSADVVLSDNRGRTLDSVTVGEIASDRSYARSEKNAWAETGMPTPGYPNTEAGFAEFLAENQIALGDIVISEVLSSNNKVDTADGGKSDFIEVENRGGSAVNLKGYGLTDNASNPAKFRFPDVTLQPGDHLAVLASGVLSTSTNYLSAPFKLSRLGSTVALFNAQDQLIDRYFIGVQQQNLSIGRAQGATETAYFEPTPGQPNGEGKAGFAGEVQFDKQPGKYEDTIQLTLSSTEGADIYYTTEKGITPTQSSIKYSGPITISKTTTVRAKAFKQGYIDSGIATATYFINTSHTLPVVTITTENNNLFDPSTGIYVNSKQDTEVPASFEVYDESGQRVFQQDIGLEMTGGLTLSIREQKSFAIYARSKYGKGTMAYPFFDNRDFTEYKSIILRTAGREGAMVTKMNNYVALGLVDGKMNVMTQAAKPCVVYLNGQYWGVYFMMEKRNKYMVAQHEGITDDSVTDIINLAKGNGSPVNNGSGDGYKEIYNYIRNHDMTLKENFDWVAARMDTDSYMDFMISEIYIANNDPGNLQCYQIPPDGKWKQIYQDLDISFYSFEALKMRRNPATAGSDIFNGMLKHKPWRDAFIERFAWALKNIYNQDLVTAAVDKAADLMRGEVAAENARWSGERPAPDKWEADVNAMKSFAKKRGQAVVGELKQQFSLTDAQKQMLDDAIK